MILSSQREGLPTVLIESLILGTPIVSTNCPSGPKEIMEDYLKEYLAKVNDYTDLANKINFMLENLKKIDRNLIKKFEMNEIIKKYIQIIEEKNNE